jgi:predicted signal transduction protein with EAL and GGDEF domain
VLKIAWVTGIATAISVAFVAWLTGGRGDQHTVGVISLIILGLLVIIVLTRQFIVVAKIRRLLVMAADQALRDPLTGLANRALFHDRLTHAMQLHQRDNQSVAVLSLDLDDFKMVNDNLGHPAGDALLVLAAERILGCVRAGDTVARLGGDESPCCWRGEPKTHIWLRIGWCSLSTHRSSSTGTIYWCGPASDLPWLRTRALTLPPTRC